MSYVRQDTAPQPAAAEAAYGRAGQGPLAAAQAADSTQGVAAADSAIHTAAAAAGSSLHKVADAAASATPSPQQSAAEVIPVITFLYKLAEGAADESFGLNVAQVWTCFAACVTLLRMQHGHDFVVKTHFRTLILKMT
jgi:hypothetical protein